MKYHTNVRGAKTENLPVPLFCFSTITRKNMSLEHSLKSAILKTAQI